MEEKIAIPTFKYFTRMQFVLKIMRYFEYIC